MRRRRARPRAKARRPHLHRAPRGNSVLPPPSRFGAFPSGVFLFGALLFGAALFGARNVGITWDEPEHVRSARAAAASLSRAAGELLRLRPLAAVAALRDDPAWALHPETPGLPRLLQGAGALLFSPLLPEPWAERAVSSLLWIGMLGCVWLLGRDLFGNAGGALAAACTLGMPRLAGHGLLAATESSLLFSWFLSALRFGRALEGRAPGWAFGAAFGTALAAKFQALALLPLLFAWAFLYRPRRALVLAGWGLALGPAVFVALQPHYWREPLRKAAYLWNFHTEHFPIPLHYLGEHYSGHGPWHYAPLVLAAVTPLPVLGAALWGAFRALRSFAARWTLPLILAAVPLALLSLPQAPTYDGERLFVQALPAVALLAGGALAEVLRRAPRILHRPLLAGAFVLSALTLVWNHPFHLAYYGGAVGGPKGALALGFESTYWLDAVTADFRKEMDRILPLGAKVQCVSVQMDVLRYCQDRGMLRKDLAWSASEEGTRHVLAYRRQGFVSDTWFRELPALTSVAYRGVTLVKLAERSGGVP